MKTYTKIMAVMAVLALALIPVGLSFDNSDAAVSISEDAKVVSAFDNSTAGKVSIVFKNSGSEALNITITASVRGSEDILATATVPIAGAAGDTPATATAEIGFHIRNAGQYDVVFTATATDTSGNHVDFPMNETSLIINVGTSIWSNWTTYLVVIIVVIVVAIAVILKMRSAPKVEADTTFTEMAESGKNAKKDSKAPATTTEKKAYVSKRKKE
jgi:hypothetical protein